MSKKSLLIVETLFQNWYSEYESLNYSGLYPYEVCEADSGVYYVLIRPVFDSNFCSSVLIEKVVQIANAACVNYHLSYEDGLVFTLH